MNKINFFRLANFFEKQIEFLRATKENKFVLYGGSAGSGKSYALRWISLYYALYYAKKYGASTHIGLFCKTYKELEDRHLKYIRQEFPEWLGDFYEQKKEFHLKEEYGGAIISFRNLDEPEKYLSAEFALMAIDEITQIPFETFKILLTRLRYPGIEDTKFICASNPIGEHMLWVRQFFVEKNLPSEFEKYRNQIAFIKALPHDNPYLNYEYFEQLKSLPEKERGAFLDGDWYAFEGEMDESGFISLITSKELENAFVFGEEFEKIFKNSENILGVDVGAGGDKTAIVLRNNLLAKVVFNQKLEDTMQIITLIFNLSKIYPIIKICIDAIGVGRGVVDRLREIGFLNLIPIVLGNKSSEPDFLNIRAELYWKLRNWILGGGKLIKDDSFNQILNIKYKKNSDKKIMIIPKDILRKRGIPSPDVADALALTFFVDIDKIKSLLNFQKEWYNI